MNEPHRARQFRSMDEGTAEDWAIIGSHFLPYRAGPAATACSPI